MKEKYKGLTKNIALFTICNFGQKFLSFFLVPLYTSFLSTEEYGNIDLIINIANLLVGIATIKISSAVMRYTMQNKNDTRYLSYGLTVSVAACLFISVLGLVFWIFPVPILSREYYVWIVALGMCYIFNTLFTDYLRGIDAVALMVTASVINTLVNLCLNILLIVVFRLGVTGFMLGNCCGILSAILIVQFQKKIIQKSIRSKKLLKEEKQEVYRYSIPLIFSSLAWWVNSSLDRFFVTYIKGNADNGIYSVAYKIPNILSAFENVFAQAWILSSVKDYDKDDTDGYFKNIYEIYNAGITLTCSLIMLMNIPLSRILYAKDFFEAWRCVPVLLLATQFLCLKTFIGGIYTAVKNTKFSMYLSFGSAAVNSVLNAILIPVIGIFGAGVATCVSYFGIYFISLICVRKYINLRLNYIKEEVAHVLLLLQMICATLESHLYEVQICILAVLLVMFYKRYLKVFMSIIKVLKSKLGVVNRSIF